MKLDSPGLVQRRMSTAHAALRELSDEELITFLTTYLRGHQVALAVVDRLNAPQQPLFKGVRA